MLVLIKYLVIPRILLTVVVFSFFIQLNIDYLPTLPDSNKTTLIPSNNKVYFFFFFLIYQRI